MFLAARNATGTAIINANIVPKVAIFNVSQIGLPNCVKYSHLGGVARVHKSVAILGRIPNKKPSC